MTIRELMSAGLIAVRRETPVLEARDLMVKKRIRHLLVTDTGGVLQGIVTDRDIRLNLPSQATSLSVREITHLLTKLTPGQVMTQSVTTVGSDQLARDGARLMLDHKVGALPVLDDGHLVGIVTEADIVGPFLHMTAPVTTGRHWR